MNQSRFKDNRYSKWFLPLLWQIFLGFFCIKFFVTPLPFPGMWLCIGALVIYLLAYFWGYFQQERNRLLAAMIMVACGVVAAPYNFGASVFFQFAAFYLRGSTKPTYALLLVVLLVSIILWLYFRYTLPFNSFLMPALLVSVSLGIFGIFERQKRINEQALAKSEAQLQRMAAIAERERIGRDLHDVLGHTLTVITLKSSVAKKLIENKDYGKARTEIAQVEETARQTSKMLQKVVSDYGEISLEDEFNNLVLLLEQVGLLVQSKIDLPLTIEESVKKALSLIVRESVTNVIRHAKAKVCCIQLEGKKKQVTFSIKDNGKAVSEVRFGNGLRGIKQRVEALQGTFHVSFEKGTLLEVIIPVSSS